MKKKLSEMTLEELWQLFPIILTEHKAGVPIDYSFLKYKKEMLDYGFQVGKISMKEETVFFEKDK